uniref:Uncharacterized protein n=1 Tax=Arundo donax TaxID=35708 RepID=A0A0A9BRZ2_ARUDO
MQLFLQVPYRPMQACSDQFPLLENFLRCQLN